MHAVEVAVANGIPLQVGTTTFATGAVLQFGAYEHEKSFIGPVTY